MSIQYISGESALTPAELTMYWFLNGRRHPEISIKYRFTVVMDDRLTDHSNVFRTAFKLCSKIVLPPGEYCIDSDLVVDRLKSRGLL